MNEFACHTSMSGEGQRLIWMNLDFDLVNFDEFAGSMNLSEESPRWIWMNESAEPGNEARKDRDL